MSPTHGTSPLPSPDRQTLIEGLRHKDATFSRERVLACDALRRPNLTAHCVSCGANASDWRRLLGIGAQIVPATPPAGHMVLRHPHACSRCGGSDLIVAPSSAAAAA
jgi:hypothetical protein